MSYDSDNDYSDIYEIDSQDEWINGAYDENGDSVFCDICGGEMKWNQSDCLWFCQECGQVINRSQWFNYIGANPPSYICITNCKENYPFCKKYCDRVSIHPDDPMLI